MDIVNLGEVCKVEVSQAALIAKTVNEDKVDGLKEGKSIRLNKQLWKPMMKENDPLNTSKEQVEKGLEDIANVDEIGNYDYDICNNMSKDHDMPTKLKKDDHVIIDSQLVEQHQRHLAETNSTRL